MKDLNSDKTKNIFCLLGIHAWGKGEIENPYTSLLMNTKTMVFNCTRPCCKAQKKITIEYGHI